MKKHYNKKILSLAAAALVLTAGVSAGKAMAYFTTYAEASGSAVLNLGTTTTIPDEEVKDWVKHVTIENTSRLLHLSSRRLYNPDCIQRPHTLSRGHSIRIRRYFQWSHASPSL